MVVAVTFLDHIENSEELWKFILYGRVKEITPEKVIIQPWVYADGFLSDEVAAHNEKTYTLIRSAILKVRKL